MKYNFVKKWDEDVSIDWWRSSRIELNKIIEIYNNWQIDGFDFKKSILVLSNIQYGKNTIGSRDGGSGYLDELIKMEEFVKEYLSYNTIDLDDEYNDIVSKNFWDLF